jgi:predicted nucleic acid-binding protein
MSDEALCFVDSNIWLYMLLPGQDEHKSRLAKQLIRANESQIVLSTQVVNEVINTILRHGVLNEAETRELIGRFYARYIVNQITKSIQIQASHLRDAYSLSHWDSLIVAAGLAAKVTVLYTEDMHDGLIVNNQLEIVNPFAREYQPHQ